MKVHFKEPKVCACGHVHLELPKTAVMAAGLGYWFDCEGGCGSTLLSSPKFWRCDCEQPEEKKQNDDNFRSA